MKRNRTASRAITRTILITPLARLLFLRGLTRTWMAFRMQVRSISRIPQTCVPCRKSSTWGHFWVMQPTLPTCRTCLIRTPFRRNRRNAVGSPQRLIDVLPAQRSIKTDLCAFSGDCPPPMPPPSRVSGEHGSPTMLGKMIANPLSNVVFGRSEKSRRQSAGEAGLEVQQPNPLRRNRDADHT